MGVDLQKSRRGGDYVLATRSGKVIASKRMRGYGRLIAIHHDDGYVSRYAHLRQYLVKPGMRVEAGDKIGIVGQTGRASTPHLHFEILTPGGKFIDPMTLLGN